jgi:ketosteroid isomerase-like protein
MSSVEAFQRAYQSFLDGEPGEFLAFLDERVTYHLPGKHLGGGTLYGRRAILERATKASLACDAPPRVELLHIAAHGPFVVTFEHVTASRAGRTLDQFASVVWLIKDDRCVEIWSHFADHTTCNEFWHDFGV